MIVEPKKGYIPFLLNVRLTTVLKG